MRIRIIAIVAGLLLALGAVVALPASPAEAHNYDPPTTYVCAATRPGGTTLGHAWPYALGPGYVDIWCRAGFFGVDHQWFIRRYPATGQVVFLSGYQSCKSLNHDGGIIWCGWPPAHPPS